MIYSLWNKPIAYLMHDFCNEKLKNFAGYFSFNNRFFYNVLKIKICYFLL